MSKTTQSPQSQIEVLQWSDEIFKRWQGLGDVARLGAFPYIFGRIQAMAESEADTFKRKDTALYILSVMDEWTKRESLGGAS